MLNCLSLQAHLYHLAAAHRELHVVEPGQLGPGLLHLRLAHVGGHNPGEVRRQQARELSWLTRLYYIILHYHYVRYVALWLE